MSRLSSSHSTARFRRIQRLARERPSAYRARLVAFALLGYAYVAMIAVCLVGAMLAVAFLARWAWSLGDSRKFQGLWSVFFAALGLTWLVSTLIHALRLKFDEPAGLILRPQDAPALFKSLARLGDSLRTPPIDRVLLTEELNASVLVLPALGGLGRSRVFLEIGLPLLHSLSPDQFTGTLAHELGHLSGSLNRFRLWLIMLNLRWDAVYKACREPEFSGSLLIKPFVIWYYPRLAEASHAILRAVEFEADALAAKAVGVAAHGEGCIASAARAVYLDEVLWPAIHRLVARNAKPPEDLFERLRDHLTGRSAQTELAGWLQWQLAQPAGIFDTHPTLSERLEALHYPTERDGAPRSLLPPAPGVSAAEFFLGTSENELTRVLSASWSQRVQSAWMRTARDAAARMAVLEQLRARDREQPLEGAELWQLARLTEEFLGRRVAFDAYRRHLEANRDNPRASLAFGRVLVEEGDGQGIPFMEFAMEADPFVTLDACRILCRYHYLRGEFEEARAHERRFTDASARLSDALAERTRADADDPMFPHGMDDATVERLRERLARIGEIDRAWLARKGVQHFPTHLPCVLGVRLARGVIFAESDRERLRDWIDFPLPLIIVTNSTWRERRVLCRIEGVDGSTVFERGSV